MKELAVVTGGSQGIGHALIKKLAKEGFSIATCARHSAPLEELSKEILADYPEVTFMHQTVDVGKHHEVVSFAQAVQNMDIPVALLVNNAGVFIPGQIHTEEVGVFEQTMHTNVFGPYYLTRALVGDMIARQEGHIFNLCSTASVTAYTNGGAYCISKFALLGMSKVLREELKPHGVRVTSVLPGATLTQSWAGTELPEERFMPADDIAETILAAYHLSKRSVVEEVLLRPQLGDIT